jgi:hypothetical protein
VDGYQVDPEALAGYVRTARDAADDLAALSRRELGGVQGLAGDSFGKIGAETGFAEALDKFGSALRLQVKAVGDRAGHLSDAVADTVRDYREQERDKVSEILGLLRHVQGGHPDGD